MTEKRIEDHRKTVLAWAKAHPKERSAINKRYRERHKAELRQAARDRRARMTPEERKAYYKRQYSRHLARCAVDPEYAARRKAQDRKNHLRYIATHKKEIAARHKKWADSHKEYLAAYKRRKVAENPEHFRAVRRAYYHRDIELTQKKKRDYRRRNLEQVLKHERDAEARRTERKMTDAAYYAAFRASRRIGKAKKRILAGKVYSPRFHTRIPDWATKGQFTIDFRSQWLESNLTASQIAFAKEHLREVFR